MAASPRPNALLIISDDQGYCELGSFLKFADPETLQPLQKDVLSEMLQSKEGREAVQVCFDAVKKATPNLDRIAGEGIRFTNFYAAPTCGPSRAALMSARYPQDFGAYSNTELSDGAGVPSFVGFPVKVFADAGYRTGVFGKWHLGTGEGQHPNDKGFDTYFGYDRAHTDKYDSPHLYRNREKAKAEGWLCDQMTDEALGFLDSCETEKKPFFLFLSLCEPKPPSPAPPQDYMDAINSGSFVVDSHFGSIYGMDFNVGRILDKIKAMGADENTMILFASDNGLNNGVWRETPDYRTKNGQKTTDRPAAWPRVPIPGNGPLRGAKWSAWDGGVRTPMFAYVPGGKSGESAALQHIMDLMPTALDYAGLDADLPLDGKSFLTQLKGTSKGDPKRALFWAHLDAIPMALDGHSELQAMDKEFRSMKRRQVDYFAGWYVRSGKWKLIGWNSDAPLLFDVAADPGEYKNLAAQNPEIVSSLRREFLKWMEGNKEPYVGKKEIWQKLSN